VIQEVFIVNRKGQTLIVVLGILVIFMIFIPAIVYMTRQEALWTVKQKRTTAAFHAAEAGIDRAMWKLRENSTNWESVMAGGHFYGYMGLTPYDVYAGTDNTKLISQY
jgi:Tfp pilus assembly protein PilX